MPRLVIIIALLLHCLPLWSQVLEGVVLDKDTKEPIIGVTIINRTTGIIALSDTSGRYQVGATAGDTITFTHTAYQRAREIMIYSVRSRYVAVLMEPNVYHLKEATVTRMTKYQQDSIARHKMYDHELSRPLLTEAHMSPAVGIATIGFNCTGCIGWLVDKITGNSKRMKRFRSTFASEDESKFIDTRYTYDIVSGLTHISDSDSVANFIYACPMPYDFARQASDLELKIWIREQYRQYIARTPKRD